MAESPLRVGIIGAGTAGGRHAAALARLGDARTTAVADPDAVRGGALAAQFGARHFPEAGDGFWQAVDAVCVCPPHDRLATAALAAIERGKATLLEKPMALTLADADAIIAAASRSAVPLMVGFVHRFRAEVQAARRAVLDGLVGSPAFAVEHLISGGGPTPGWIWRRDVAGGGVLLYNGVHGIDRLRWLLGREVTSVFARATATRATEVEDVLVATLGFGDVSASFVQHIGPYPLPAGWRSELYGTGGALLISPDGSLVQATADRTTVLRPERDDRFLFQAREFVAAVRHQRPPAVTGEDGRAALAVALALYESAATGHVVPLSAPGRAAAGV